MKNSIIISLSLAMVCISVWLINVMKSKNEPAKTVQNNAIVSGSLHSSSTVADQNALKNNNVHIPDNLSMTGEQGNVSLKDVLNPRGKNLFFRIDDAYCIDCIDTCISQLNKLVDTAKLKVIVIGKFQNRQSGEFFRQKLKKFHAFYSVNALPLPGEEAIQPYFFVLDQEFKTKRSFFPNKDEPTMIQNYLITQM